jgi:hypothetical protein
MSHKLYQHGNHSENHSGSTDKKTYEFLNHCNGISHMFQTCFEHLKFSSYIDDCVGDFQNNGITLEPKVVTLHGNHSYTLEHYYLLIDNEP